MAVLGELLFYRSDGVDLDTVLRHRLSQLGQKVGSIPSASFDSKSDDELAAQLATSEAVTPLEADFANATAKVSEISIRVHDEFFNERPIQVAGLRATKSIPFNGDAELWRLRTNPFNMNPPRGDVSDQKVIVGIEVRAHEVDEAKRYIDDAIASIPEYLERQKTQIEAHNKRIVPEAIRHIQQRRARLSNASDLLKKLQE